MPPTPHAHKIKIEVEVLQRGPVDEEKAAQLQREAYNAVARTVNVGSDALVQSQARIIPLYDAHDVQGGGTR